MIHLNSVSKRYGARVVLDDVSFVAHPGRVTGFVGPNGAGKSTCLRIVSGLTTPSAGIALVDGRPLREAVSAGSTLGVFLTTELIPDHLTAQAFLAYACDLQGLPMSRVVETLETVGLAGDGRRRIRTFSLGMRQRLGIGAALVGRPRHLLLDEPVNGLDPDGIIWLRSLVSSMARAGGAVLLSSHHMSELALVADDVVMLDHGRVARAGELSSFVSEGTPRTYVEVDDLTAALVALSRSGYDVEPIDGGLVVTGQSPQAVGAVLFREGLGVSHLRLLERTLEETYFTEVTGKAT